MPHLVLIPSMFQVWLRTVQTEYICVKPPPEHIPPLVIAFLRETILYLLELPERKLLGLSISPDKLARMLPQLSTCEWDADFLGEVNLLLTVLRSNAVQSRKVSSWIRDTQASL
jgi:hypothetical protein